MQLSSNPLNFSKKIIFGILFFFTICPNSLNAQFGSEIIIKDTTSSIHPVDIDGDGDMDFISSNYSSATSSSNVVWYENAGDATFPVQHFIVNQSNALNVIHTDDIDGDGDMDMLGYFGHNIFLFKNNGDGTFENSINITNTSSGVSHRSMHTADIDGDGHIDIITYHGDWGEKMAWYQNNGDGTFGIENILSTDSEGIDNVFAADMDGDGDIDLLSASDDSFDNISWYENDGSGNFISINTIYVSPNGLEDFRSIDVSDLDGDGDMDVISAARGTEIVAWYENNGNGSFGSPNIIADFSNSFVDGFPRYAFSADLDLDGDLDVISASSGKIYWYENNGNGDFGVKITISDLNINNLYATDLDGDGDKDILISSSSFFDKVVWHQNNYCPPTTGTDNVIECNSYTWIDGITYTESNNSASYILTNTAGCDSIISLNLTINSNTTEIDNIVECDSDVYTWIDGITYSENNNSASYLLTTVDGCDSMVTLNLLFNTTDVSITSDVPILTSNSIGSNYQWLDCDSDFLPINGAINQSFTATSNGNYSVVINQNGCMDTSACVLVDNIVNTVDPSFQNDISVFPNPTTGMIQINLGKRYDKTDIEVINTLGQVILSSIYWDRENVLLELNGENGIYFFRIKTEENKIATLKIVKY